MSETFPPAARGVAALACLALLAPPGPPAAQAADNPAVALARRLDARHARLRDLTARFVQSYRSGLMGREVVESGKLSLKRPGRMLWQYQKPEPKTFLSDGRSYYFYVPSERQVVVRDQAADARSLPTLLLAGRGDIVGQFDLTLEQGPPGLQRLRLVPRAADPEVERVYLDVDARDRVLSIEVLDAQGNRSRYRFEDIRENVGLSDKLFHFEVPRGVDVVRG